MANLILCTDYMNADSVLREHKKRYPDTAIETVVCHTEEQLVAALTLAEKESGSAVARRFAIKTQDGVRILPLSEIVYCQCESHRYRAVLLSGEEIVSRSFRKSFPQVLAPLLESGEFLQCQASYIVNMRYIRAISEKQMELQNGAKLPFPLSRQEQVRALLGFPARH